MNLMTAVKWGVELRGVCKSFGTGGSRIQVLHDVEIDLPLGEMTFIVGPSGCGKTTLISIVGGILNADAGNIRLLGEPQNSLKESERSKFRNDNIGFIFQQFNLVPTLNVLENIAIPLLIKGVKFEDALNKASILAEKVGLAERIHFFPRDLSGGQQQRVAVARALINNPKILICDEPTASLDGQTGMVVMELLKSIAMAKDRTVIIVTHDNRIYHYADRIVEMEDGRIKHVQVRGS